MRGGACAVSEDTPIARNPNKNKNRFMKLLFNHFGAAGTLCKFGDANQFAQFQNVERAVGPVVLPADDQITPFLGVAMAAVIAAFIFKFNEDALPAVPVDAAHGFAIGKAVLDVHDHETQTLGHGPKKIDDSRFVDRTVSELRGVQHRPVDAAIQEQSGLSRVAQKCPMTRAVVGSNNLKNIAPLAHPACFSHVLSKGATNLVPAAKAAAQRALTMLAESAKFQHGGQVVDLSCDVGPLAEEIGQGRLAPCARGFHIAHLQGAVEASEMLLDEIAADAGHVAEFSCVGRAPQLAGAGQDGGFDLLFGGCVFSSHGSSLLSSGNKKATRRWLRKWLLLAASSAICEKKSSNR